MSSGMVPLELSKDNNQYCKISVFMPNAGSINESVISVTNVGGDSFSVAVSMIRWNANKVFCKLINGTKISNINMYYTVDTERFCFYIKANWYAKIIVSRLGLVNTSKIESINAIPSGAIEVPISWRDKRYSTDLGELLGNPKGTKSFSSWSEFTDFVNEMPIKTIQPFVSDFNAFAGEGFYGNIVQGLVIKQLEDAVFIFGIAIDGTLIFRKRNYPDVSTWEDPKIIIHSNNWHKIYFVTDLGGLIGVTTPTKDGLMPKNQVCRNIAKINNLHCRLKCNINSPGEWVNGFLYVGSTSGSVSTIAVSVMIWNETKVFCKLINGVKGYISSISYIQETNSISLFVEMAQYANILFAPMTQLYSSSLETVESIPSDAINLDFWHKKTGGTGLYRTTRFNPCQRYGSPITSRANLV